VEFDWDEANTAHIAHIARHGVRPWEPEKRAGSSSWSSPVGGAGCGRSPPGTPPPRRSGGTERGV